MKTYSPILLLACFLFFSCEKWDLKIKPSPPPPPPVPPTLPIITTTAINSITLMTAISGGNITNDGGASITARGVCWSTSTTPIATGSHTTDGTGIGTFTSSITGLIPNTYYYLRAYATN